MMNDAKTIMDAYYFYTDRGIIVHPLSIPQPNNRKTGKSPVYTGWNERKQPYHENFMKGYAEQGYNLGIACGRASDVTVLDIDWYCMGIIDYIFDGLSQADINNFVKQKHQNPGANPTEKGHFFFRYTPEVQTGINKELGFDVLGQNVLGKSQNCVCHPSIHADGSMYRFNKDIAERKEMPASVVKKINEIIELYDGLKGVLRKCRPVFQKLWRAVAEEEESDIYHVWSIFRNNNEGRNRSLGLFTELLVHGATVQHCHLVSMMIFGREYDPKLTNKELGYIDITKTMTNVKIQSDEYLSRYYTSADFDPFDATLDEMEKKLSVRAMEAYERILIEAAYADFDAVRKAFLVGVFSNGCKLPEVVEAVDRTADNSEVTNPTEQTSEIQEDPVSEPITEILPVEQNTEIPTPGLDILKAAGCIV